MVLAGVGHEQRWQKDPMVTVRVLDAGRVLLVHVIQERNHGSKRSALSGKHLLRYAMLEVSTHICIEFSIEKPPVDSLGVLPT